jgi:hypothetical protein
MQFPSAFSTETPIVSNFEHPLEQTTLKQMVGGATCYADLT